MVFAAAVLLGCQALGEGIVTLTGAPVPGPVVGMVLLFVGLTILGRVPDNLSRLTDGLLSHLSLLFVPAGVGVVATASLIVPALWPIALAITLGTLLTMVITGRVAQALDRRDRP